MVIDQFLRQLRQQRGISVRPTACVRYVPAFDKTEFAERFAKCRGRQAIGRPRPRLQHADVPDFRLRLSETQAWSDRTNAKSNNQFASAVHSIIRSARNAIEEGIFTPIAFAVRRLTTSSTVLGSSIGRSDGFAPRKTRST